MIEKELEGGWFARVWLDRDHRIFVHYEVLHIAAWGDKPEFRKKGTDFNDHQLTDNPADAHAEIKGEIKWDGCSHNTFFADDNGYFHACGRGSLVALADVFAWLYDQASELMRADGQHVEGLEP